MMGVEEVREYFARRDLQYEIQELDESTETVELAARALGVQPALIAKTLVFKMNDKGIIIVTRGDARVDSKKFKQVFQTKPKMMSADEVFEMTGHKVGGVCPFGLKQPLEIFLDVSLEPFDTVYPAAGSPNSHIEITPDDLCRITHAHWVDVCRDDSAQ
jgi:Cys-tRNA(Pro) deacylase